MLIQITRRLVTIHTLIIHHLMMCTIITHPLTTHPLNTYTNNALLTMHIRIMPRLVTIHTHSNDMHTTDSTPLATHTLTPPLLYLQYPSFPNNTSTNTLPSNTHTYTHSLTSNGTSECSAVPGKQPIVTLMNPLFSHPLTPLLL